MARKQRPEPKFPKLTAQRRDEILREILGYLNFSSGTPDAGFQRSLNFLVESLPENDRLEELRRALTLGMAELQKTTPAFRETAQAEAVLKIVLDDALPGYRLFHNDLLFHVKQTEFEHPLFLARVFEAVLVQGEPWDETERIVDAAVNALNDFVGIRPVAVLENDRPMEPYPHEFYRPIPIYFREAGVAAGRYHDLIQRTVDFFAQVPDDLQQQAHFDLSHMDELAVDIRAYDHLHPVNKRTNYMFGEWDPRTIGSKGFYRRFVIRGVILDSLLSWMDTYRSVSREERLHDAAAVLCGTMLMASAISGAAPDTHDSAVSLSTLLPQVAQHRDLFYEYLLNQSTGPRAKRLQKEAKNTQQPFGHVRKHLNIELARYGAHQVHCRFLSQFYAQIGSPVASRRQAAIVPSPAARFESEIGWRLTAGSRDLNAGNLKSACEYVREIGGLIDRGIDCGAIVDPWNILAFQGQFPLFQSREDAIPDQRIDLLLDFLERYFDLFSKAISEAAARGETALSSQLTEEFRERAEWWDRFAASVVDELPKVHGVETCKSAERVSDALSQWQQAGEAAGDISFWRQHVDKFESPSAYGQVVTSLLDKGDHVAAMGLLMQWISQAEDVGLEAGEYSFNAIIQRWIGTIIADDTNTRPGGQETWTSIRRLFDFLEANAGEFWSVPSLDPDDATPASNETVGADDENFNEDEFWQPDQPGLYDAAYDDVVFTDSAEDGNVGDTLDEGFRAHSSPIEVTGRLVEPRLAFLKSLAELWETAAEHLLTRSSILQSRAESTADIAAAARVTVNAWRGRLRTLERGLSTLLIAATEYEIAPPTGDYESNYEYDLQTQSRHMLQHQIVETILACRNAGWKLHACSPVWDDAAQSSEARKRISEILALIFGRDVVGIRRTLPGFLVWLSKQPLLYVPLEHDGDPKRYLAIRTLQSVLRIMLVELAQLGFLDEVWQILKTAHRMERAHRPAGMATTEFDQLFRIGLKNSLECLIRSADRPLPLTVQPRPLPRTHEDHRSKMPRLHTIRRVVGRPLRSQAVVRRSATPSVNHPRRSPDLRLRTEHSSFLKRLERSDALIEVVGFVVERYQELWQKYSRSIRISSVEALHQKELWEQVRRFIEEYGDDFFQTPMLMVSNIRSILHLGLESYLKYLAAEDDPLNPNRLLEAIERGEIESESACHFLELVYECILDKLERFIEYNTTTTQSDYGHQLYCLLDFLRAEAGYDRDAWNLKPYWFAHEVLTETGHGKAAGKWESVLRERSAPKAAKHERKLRRLEKTYGVCLPSLADHIGERFVKSLAVNRMLALVPFATTELKVDARSVAFDQLQSEIERYLETTAGSAIEVPDWLVRLDREVQITEARLARPATAGSRPDSSRFVPLRARQVAKRLRDWPQPPDA